MNPGVPLRRLAWLPAAVALAIYAVAMRADFTSEDFLLLRVLGEAPPWRDLPAAFTEPWLGITVVEFWRPVSTLLLALERAAFGAWAPGYHLCHAAVHAVNATLVARLAEAWPAGRTVAEAEAPTASWAAPTAGVLFAIHPLHPNAVIFVASFATLFAATFILAALLAYRESRRRGRGWGWLAAAVACAALALGCYEAAVLLPPALIVAELLPGAPPASLRRRLAALTPFVGLVGLYFLVRKRLFDEIVGGYAATGDRLHTLEPLAALRDLMVSLGRLAMPDFASPPGLRASAAIALALAVGVGLAHVSSVRRGRPSPLTVTAFSGAWVVLGFAPFAFQPFVPGNGRYAYISAAGFAWLLAAAWPVPIRLPAGELNRSAALGRAAYGVVAVAWTALVAGGISTQLEAGREAGAVRTALLDRIAGEPRPARLFVGGHPDFLRNERGVPLAAVLRYGLDDSLRPPFASAQAARGVEIYPLPAGSGRPPGFETQGIVLHWEPRTGRLIAPPDQPPPPALEAEAVGAQALGIRFRPLAGASSHRLVFLTRGNPGEVALVPAADDHGWAATALPGPFVESMARLYGPAPVYWWIEARGATGEILAASPLAAFQNRSLSP